MFVTARHSIDNITYTYSDAYIGAYTGNLTTIKAETTIGTDYTFGSGQDGKTNIDNIYDSFYKPKTTFADGKVTISKNVRGMQTLPFVFYQKHSFVGATIASSRKLYSLRPFREV